MLKNIWIHFLLISAINFAGASEFHVDKSKSNQVKFISDAPMEDFEGVTESIDGYMFWEDADTLGSNEIYFEVDLNTLDTGIGLRNRHMRENYLETEKYPTASFKGKIEKLSQNSEGNLILVANGIMFIHGIEQQKSVEAQLIAENEGFKIVTSFSLALPDYEIEIPQLMFLKINENIKLELEFHLKNVKPE